MGIESIIIFLIVGAIAGWLAGIIVKGFGFGLLGNIVVGIVGAFIAGWLFPQLGWGVGGGFLWAIVHATIGAVILLVLLRIIRTGT
ncbi:MAG: GlsB/YeaQ/YmgE family stress response membrane protein [Rhizobium sp.]|nr:GlsB/YeaQ/YmgE family stress response membrane protein [Rhizobium sp.]